MTGTRKRRVVEELAGRGSRGGGKGKGENKSYQGGWEGRGTGHEYLCHQYLSPPPATPVRILCRTRLVTGGQKRPGAGKAPLTTTT